MSKEERSKPVGTGAMHRTSARECVEISTLLLCTFIMSSIDSPRANPSADASRYNAHSTSFEGC